MAYSILIKQQAKKKLLALPKTERTRIAEQIQQLGINPDNPELDIKKLVGDPHYRLRVGNWRIIFDRQDEVRIIAIEKIKARGDAYK